MSRFVRLFGSYTRIDFGQFSIMFFRRPLLNRGGVGRVTRELLTNLQALSSGRVGRESQPARLAARQIYYFSTIHWCPQVLPQPAIVMVHDVIPLLFPEKFSQREVNRWKDVYIPILRQARLVVTVSETSAYDISRVLEIPRKNVHVVYNGVTHLQAVKSNRLRLPDSPYVAYVGSEDPHKNLQMLFRVLSHAALSNIHLVLVGEFKAAPREARMFELEGRVHFTGYLKDHELAFVIQNAQALLLPSLYEGSGLTPLEAAALGTPTVCSNRPAMNELLKGAVLFAEPDDVASWALAVASLLADSRLRSRLVNAAKSKIMRHKWQDSARAILRLAKDISV